MKEKEFVLKGQDGKALPFVESFAHQLSFVIGSHGLFSCGKSRLGVTGPSTTFILPLDPKTRRTVEKNMKEMGKKFGKDILMPPEGFIEELSPMQASRLDKETSTKHYRKRVEMCKEYLLAAHANPNVRLIVVDTATQLYEELCWASYGREGYKVKKIGDEPYKDKSEANQELVDLIKALRSKPLLLIHRSKDEYVGKARKPIGLTFDGYKYIGNQCDVSIFHEANKEFDADSDESNWRFALSVQACIDAVELQGPNGQRLLMDDMITLGGLMPRVFPDGDWSDWES